MVSPESFQALTSQSWPALITSWKLSTYRMSATLSKWPFQVFRSLGGTREMVWPATTYRENTGELLILELVEPSGRILGYSPLAHVPGFQFQTFSHINLGKFWHFSGRLQSLRLSHKEAFAYCYVVYQLHLYRLSHLNIITTFRMGESHHFTEERSEPKATQLESGEARTRPGSSKIIQLGTGNRTG